MKKYFWPIQIYALSFVIVSLVACQQGKETIVEKHYGTGSELPVPPSNNGGIDGGGGGNGVDGKPLESFRVELTSLDSFSVVKTKVIAPLTIRFPQLAADLLHIASERAWYLIPIDLRQLPPANIGTYFPTDQLAIQGLREVWINDVLFSKINMENQSMLILHELVMGVRLLQFTNVLDQCLQHIAINKLDPDQRDKYREERQECYRKHKAPADLEDSIGLGKQARLSSHDYETIRALTYDLMVASDTVNVDELKAWMEANSYRKY